MRRIFIFILSILISTYTNISIVSSDKFNYQKELTRNQIVSYNGWLHTDGYKLLNEKNEQIQLHGLSSHGIEWFSDLITYENLKILKEDWHINIFRIAMYTNSNGQGYIFNKEQNLEKVYQIVDMAVDLDMYVIVDWHILTDNNPQNYKPEAIDFFNKVSKKYCNTPNVIYEICNEPNGNTSWDNDIKPYAEEIIPVIRNNSSNSLIIVGTPFWCQDIDKAANNPLNFNNVVYSCHFYAGTHKQELRSKIDYCISKNIPIFVSECGATQADGNSGLYTDEFTTWINYLDSKNISWLYWSFCNKDEGSAILTPNYDVDSNNNFNNYLSNSGIFIKNVLQKYND